MERRDDKAELRREMRARRLAQIPADAARAAELAAGHLMALPAVAAASIVAIYASMPAVGEIDTAPAIRLLRAAGKRLAFPRVVAGRKILELHEPGELAPSKFGVPEPLPD